MLPLDEQMRWETADSDDARDRANGFSTAEAAQVEAAETNSSLQDRLLAAERRAAELARANDALQELTDALSTLSGMDAIVEAALRIVARVFGANATTLWDINAEGRVRLRYWMVGSRFLHAEEVLHDPEFLDDPEVQRCVNGFTVNAGYLGSLVKDHRTPVVLDHRIGTCEQDFDDFLRRHNWELELNIPLLARGDSMGTLCLYRSFENAYANSEIELASALAKQLSLAIESSRFAEAAREKAVAQERELAAEQRSAEMMRAKEALQRSISKMAEVTDLDAAITEAVKTAIHFTHAEFGSVGVFLPEERGFRNIFLVLDGQVARTTQLQYSERLYSLDEPAIWRAWEVYTTTNDLLWCDLESEYLAEDSRSWLGALGMTSFLLVGLRRGSECIGYFGLASRQSMPHNGSSHGLLTALADQIALMLECSRLAKISEEVAVAKEREWAAEQRATELANANEALRRSAEELLSATSTDEILTGLLREAVHISGATAGVVLHRIGASEFSYTAILARGAIRSAQEILQSGTDAEMRKASKLDPTGHFHAVAAGEARWRQVDDPDLAPLLPRSTAFHREAGNRMIYDVPYSTGRDVGGYLGLAFPSREPLGPGVCETIKALANQVGLALAFRRISDANERAAIESQRNAFARDLHDSLAQGYAAILMQMGAADQAGPIPEQMRPYLDRIEKLARANLLEARKTVKELRNSERTTEALPARLVELARCMELAYGSGIDAQISGPRRRLPPLVEDELFRIAQEALTNAMKHAEASQIILNLEFLEDGVRLKVKDNGKGFSPAVEGKLDHFGLLTMQERSQRINARLTIISEPGFGTEILTLWDTSSLEQL